ncbi:hypothetical protein L7F22_065768 [Adiantum nelumboides]|nr:hypothetical protein [Adiantum nelumboides]
MLAIRKGPQELCSPCSAHPIEDNQKLSAQILEALVEKVPNFVSLTLEDVGEMAYTHCKQVLLQSSGVFCMFEGNLENFTALQQEFGIAKNVNEVMLIIQAYKTLCIWGPFLTNKVVAAVVGQYVFILCYTSNHNVFVAHVFIFTFKIVVKLC